MKKTKSTNIFLAGIVLLMTTGIFSIASPPVQAADALPFLHAQGTQIVDSAGKPVILRGINIGGWLVEEPWMQPFVTTPPIGSHLPPVQDHVSLWQTMEKRLGRAQMLQARTAFREAWFNKSDLARIRKAGLNCIRLPFLASLADEPGGMTWLDSAIRWAGQNHIYVILDMHGVPGGQSDQDHTGQAGINLFFKTPADIKATESLWTRIARRYRGNPVVAGYDLINEPTGTPNSDTLYVVEDRLYRAVRAGDPDHLIFIEDGYTGIQWMPYPVPAGWTNVVYSWHSYQFNAKSPQDHITSIHSSEAQISTLQQTRQVPFYIGEFGLEPNATAQTVAAFINGFDKRGISWSMWTYKAIFPGGGQNLWALYENTHPLVPLDPYRDSLAEWIHKCVQLQTQNLTENKGIADAFQQSGSPG